MNFSQPSQNILLSSLTVVHKMKVVNSDGPTDGKFWWEKKNESKYTQWVERKVMNVLKN